MDLLQPVNTEQTQPTNQVPAAERQDLDGDRLPNNDEPPPTTAAAPAVAGVPLVDIYNFQAVQTAYCRTWK